MLGNRVWATFLICNTMMVLTAGVKYLLVSRLSGLLKMRLYDQSAVLCPESPPGQRELDADRTISSSANPTDRI